MFLNHLSPLLVSALLTSTGASASSSGSDASRSCSELAARREETDAAATRLAEWMERHCPGALENTDSFCRLQSGLLLERLDELGQLKAAIAANGCHRIGLSSPQMPDVELSAYQPVTFPSAPKSVEGASL